MASNYPSAPLAKLRAAWLTLVWRPLAWLFPRMFGRFDWQAPPWCRGIADAGRRGGATVRANPRAAASGVLLVAVLAAGGWYGYRWWQALPRPVEATFKVTAPARTQIEAEDAEARKPRPAVIAFNQSVAPLSLVGKDVAAGVTLSPALAGTWHWDDDKTLAFTPKDDWPAGAQYKARFHKGLFKPETRLADDEAVFATAPFAASITRAEFYQDPVNPTVKKVVVDLNFTYPVNPAELEKRIELRQEQQSGGILGLGKETSKFTVTYDKLKLNAYVQSDSIPIPKDSGAMRFTLAKGLSAARGSPALDAELSKEVAIPGLYSLAVTDIAPKVVTNDKNEPEQVLVLQTSATVHERELQKAMAVWVLPKLNPDAKLNPPNGDPFDWSSATVSEAALKLATRLAPEAIPAEREYTQLHSFKYRADVGAYLYVQVAKDIKSFGGYVLGKTEARVLQVPPYPSELKILSQGALLALSGEKKVAVLVRDLLGVKVEIGRVLPSQLQHLVSQSNGGFANPEFYDRFGPDNLTERFERKVPLPALERGRAHYEAVDMGEYLKGDGAERRGVFLLTVSGYDPKAEERAARDAKAAERRPGEAPPEADAEDECADCAEAPDRAAAAAINKVDKRLVLVTDLGIVVKKSQDGSQDVYIQSIYTGKPVDGASVEIVGVNGQVLFTQATDAAGHARFARIAGLARERAPLMILARKGGDLSFMPLNRYDRGLDMSRFDTGGARNAAVADQLSAYLFSDRGMYRPGDTFHIGMIAKPASWSTSIAGLPLEAEILDPRGLTVKREKLTLPPGGFIETAYTTQESAPTGSYTVNLHLVRDGQTGAQIGSTTVKVQEFQPDRLKVSARFSDGPSEGWLNPKELKAAVSALNLFGTPAQNRRVSAEITLSPAFPAFSRYPDYKFYDPLRAKEGYSAKLNDQATDDKGETTFELGLNKYAKATYRVNFVARVFEAQGGRGVAAETAALVSELPYLVGFKADGALDFVTRASKRDVALIAIDPKAQKTAVAGLTLQLVERKFVSVLTKQGNNTFKYESRKKEVTLKETPLAIAAAGQNLALETGTPGNFAYVIRNSEGVELNRIEYAVAGRGNVTRSLERNAELQLTLNKKDYVPGEDIEVSIKAPYAGAGLITIERDKVFVHQWFKTDTLASVQKIKVPKDFEGNGYVSVQFIRDPGSDEIFMSPLSYGAAPFATSLAARTNTLSLTVPELVKPGQRMTMKLKSAKPARVVVFAVDEGILQVARYQAPDPLSLFFQKRMLEVRTSQILDLILPEFKKLMQASAPGGDGDGALGRHLNPFKRKHDKPAVYWSGIVDVNGEKEFSYDVPETFNGSMRVFAVAVNDATIGTAQAKTTVRGDFVLSPNLPLAVTPGDEFDVSVGVANNVAGSGKEAPVALTLKTSAHLEVIGSAAQTLKIGEMRESVATFRIRAVDGARAQLGSATMTFAAALGAKGARLSTDVSVRPPAPRYAVTAMGSFKGSAEAPVTRNMYSEFRQLEAGVSTLPLVMASGVSNYLANFTHLCTEQVVSQAVPALILDKRPEFGKSGAKAQVARSFEDALRVLRTRQNAEGGFGMWNADVQADEFASVYAVHLLLEARDRGDSVPADMLQLGLAYIRQLAASPASDLPALRVRAYAAYLLTRQMTVTTPILASIRESLDKLYPKQWQSDPAAAYLAAAYLIQKQDRQASELMDQQVARLVKRPARAKGETPPYYVDPLVEDAQTLYILSRHFPARAKALPPEAMAALVKPLAENRYNTLSGAYSILAFDAYATAVGAEGAGKLAIVEIDAKGGKKALALPNNLVPRVPFTPGTAKLRFANDSGVAGYYSVTEAGFDREVPKAEVRAGMEVLREFVDAAGKPVTTIMVGDEVTVRLKFRAVGRAWVGNVALVDLMPGGFEPVLETPAPPAPPGETAPAPTTSLPGLAGGKATWKIHYADVREDRVVFYGHVTSDFSELSYRIKATNSGRFVLPPAYAESMYERAVQARSAGGQVIIVETPGKK
ncbi:alpha-2-macroglobulin [Massilia sp. R2A-15]|uniref:alpha-2-macroglobulin n=1 Tax=Massilia sp. R2A-15 TaxID=3064278 RepID=UPI002735B7E4|nr:alpha-2-macroglobulin [Massilia sp. R2A-15]WLI89106.1 alpha-2-macroglobulin [Massilia sp. R2A-15]